MSNTVIPPESLPGRGCTSLACKALILAALLLAIVMAVAGCSPSQSSTGSSGIKAAVSAHATSSAAKSAKAEAKSVLQKCFNQFGNKLPGDYKQFGDCAGVPPQNRKAFARDAVTAAFGAHLSTQTGRDTFYTVTLPQLQKKCQTSC